MKALPQELVAYHEAGRPLNCKIPTEPWGCEFWPLDQVLTYNKEYQVPEYAPGYFGFATSGGGEMYAFSPSGAIVCLAFVSMSPKEELPVAKSWSEFEALLESVL